MKINIFKVNTILKAVLFIATCHLYFATIAIAEPYLAQRYGQKCSACHVNKTGGGMRTDLGSAYAKGLSSTPVNSVFSPKISDAISIGADFRADWSYSSFDDPEPVGGITGPEVDNTNNLEVSNGAVYLDFTLSDKIHFYLDQQVAPEGGRTRESVVIISDILGKDSYLKVGRFFLPFGLRLQDDDAYIRQVTGYNFDNADTGYELGYEPGAFSLSVAISNGTQGAGENNINKQVSMVASYIKSGYRLGASFAHNKGVGATRQAYNIFGGINYGKWSFLAEADWLEDSSEDNLVADHEQFITYVAANYLFGQSTNIKLTYELLDPNEDIDEDERNRFGVLAERFFNQYLQVRGGIKLDEGIPQIALHNRQTVFAELHLFF